MVPLERIAAREKRIPRAQIAETLRQAGIPADRASEITDLGLKAAFDAMDALLQVPDLSPDPLVKVNALRVARGVIAAELDVLDQAIEQTDKVIGVQPVTLAVQRGAHG